MKQAYFALTFALLFAGSSAATAQSYRVPEHYAFNSESDYHKYDKDIIRAINWIEKTPVGDEPEHMKQASRFLLEWLTGCPYVHFSQNVRIDAFMSDSPQYRVYYMAGWAKYALEHKDDRPDKVSCCASGIEAVTEAYKISGGKKDTNIEELAKLQKQGKLKEWVSQKM